MYIKRKLSEAVDVLNLGNEAIFNDEIGDILDEENENSELEIAETFSSQLSNPNDSVSYDGQLRQLESPDCSLKVGSEDNDAVSTEETKLKTVYEPDGNDNNGLESIQSLESNDVGVQRTTVEDSFAKSRIVTSADQIELYGLLLRNFFESRDNGIKPQELLNRTFGMPILVMEICRAHGRIAYEAEEERFLDSCPILVNRDDEACINSYMGSRGFWFQCRRDNCFYFGVGNRGWGDVSAEISRMEGALRMLCFGRLYGRNVAGRRIESPRDLEISFRDGRFEQSSRRFYFTLFENNKPVLIRQTCRMQCLKLRYIYFLMALVYFIVCLHKTPLRKL